MKVAYRFRRILFVSGSMLVMALLTLTIPKSPYADSSSTPDRVIYVSAMQFSFAFTNEPVASKEDMGAQIVDLEISRGSLVEFRVTSLDATHGFAIYNPKGAIFAQTQAMPGYTNRLRVRFDEPGKYPVLCLEYCGAAHHMMKTS
ncbi:MAG: hypothetical protein HUU37_02275, partial [Bdellovibrionales bacterium]|nr:hypothetical protein [Bdellovibrionales bacterium]